MSRKESKFLIFSQGRTGSNLLASLINSNPDVHCDNEIFNRTLMPSSNKILQYIILRLPLLYTLLKRKRSKAISYGFKLSYYQLRNTEKTINDLHSKGWKVIYLQRRNIIKQSISWIIASETKKWLRTKGTKSITQSFIINPDQFIKVV